MENTRLLYNTAIIRRLEELVKLYPNLRFQQLLWNCNIIMQDASSIEDRYNEESKLTWQQMVDNEFCKLPNKIDEN